MAQTDSPLKRSIGLSGVIRFLIAVIAVVAVGAAFADDNYAFSRGPRVSGRSRSALGWGRPARQRFKVGRSLTSG